MHEMRRTLFVQAAEKDAGSAISEATLEAYRQVLILLACCRLLPCVVWRVHNRACACMPWPL